MQVELLDSTHEFRFRFKVPIYVANTWSGFPRTYLKSEPEFYTPEILYKGSEKIKYNGHCLARVRIHNEESLKLYNYLLESDVSPEQACIVLPQNTMVEFIETGSLSEYMILCTRIDSEITRKIAKLLQVTG